MESFVTAQRNVDTSQASRLSENLRRPKELKSNWTVKTTWLMAFFVERGKLSQTGMSHLQRETVKCGNVGESDQETYQAKTAHFWKTLFVQTE